VTEPTILRVEIAICDLCLSGAGGECHSPGCWFWMCPAITKQQADRIRDWTFTEITSGRKTSA
jgi:hypothetical protein